MFDKSKAREAVKKRLPWLFSGEKEMQVKRPAPAQFVGGSTPKKEDSRLKEICRMRFDEKKTYAEIGEVFGISRERVRQIFVAHGVDATLPPKALETVTLVCKNQKCGKEFTRFKNKKRKYCSDECKDKDNIIGKAVKDWTKEDWTTFHRYRNYTPTAIAARRRYLENNKEKLYQKNREYIKEYSKRPEVIEKKKKYLKEYLQRPEVKKRMNERQKVYYQRRMADPVKRAKMQERNRERYLKKKNEGVQ